MQWKFIAPVTILVLLAAVGAGAGDLRTTLELTGAYTSISYSDGSNYGWWVPGKYDQWKNGNNGEVGLADARMLLSGSKYSVILGLELYPTLEAQGQSTAEGSGDRIVREVEADFQAYDLALAEFFGNRSGFGVMPWVGLTYLRINETRYDPENPGGDPETAATRLWGPTIGADWGTRIGHRLLLAGRVVIRWGRGDRKAALSLGGPDFEKAEGAEVQLSDDVSRGMWGADLGVRWGATRTLQVEGGWRYRDWSYDDGPASFNGPYLRLVLEL